MPAHLWFHDTFHRKFQILQYPWRMFNDPLQGLRETLVDEDWVFQCLKQNAVNQNSSFFRITQTGLRIVWEFWKYINHFHLFLVSNRNQNQSRNRRRKFTSSRPTKKRKTTATKMASSTMTESWVRPSITKPLQRVKILTTILTIRIHPITIRQIPITILNTIPITLPEWAMQSPERVTAEEKSLLTGLLLWKIF